MSAPIAEGDPVAEPPPLSAPEADEQPLRQWSQMYDRTWELELLISGAVAFTLLQLPGALDRGFDRINPQLGEGLHQVVIFGYIYLKIILYALITTFVVHLIARAYWVGLVGLTSVFPEGVKWENTRYGPIAREYYRKRTPSLQAQSAGVDRFCSVLFSFATIIVLTFVSSTIMVVLIATFVWFLSERLLLQVEEIWLFYGIFLLVTLPIFIATQVDKRYGDRVGRRGRKGVRAIAAFLYVIQFGTLTTTISNTLFSNIKRAKMQGLFYLVFAALMGFFMVRDVFFRMGDSRIDAYDYLGQEESAQSLSYVYYENQRPAEMVVARTPSIQSDMIREPYVRLFLPYYPRWHNELVRERCPQLGREIEVETEADRRAEAARAEGLTRCLAAMQPMSLNGRPLPDPDWHYYTRPDNGLRGLIAYIPTADLPAGENELVVERIPRPRANGEDDDPLPSEPFHIPFWIAR